MIYLSDHQTIASQCAIPMPKATFIESVIYGLYGLGLDALYVFAILSYDRGSITRQCSTSVADTRMAFVWIGMDGKSIPTVLAA